MFQGDDAMRPQLWATQNLGQHDETSSEVSCVKPKWLLDAQDRNKQAIWALFVRGERCCDMGQHDEAIDRFKEAYKVAAKVQLYFCKNDLSLALLVDFLLHRRSCCRVCARRTITSPAPHSSSSVKPHVLI